MLMANGGSASNEDSDCVEKLSQRAETAERMVQYLEKEKAALAETAKLEIDRKNNELARYRREAAVAAAVKGKSAGGGKTAGAANPAGALAGWS